MRLFYVLTLFASSSFAFAAAPIDLSGFAGKKGIITATIDGRAEYTAEEKVPCTVLSDASGYMTISDEGHGSTAWALFPGDEPYKVRSVGTAKVYKSLVDSWGGKLLCGYNVGKMFALNHELTVDKDSVKVRVRFWCAPLSSERLGKHVYEATCRF